VANNRDDIHQVFEPIFKRILELIKRQIDVIQRNYGEEMKVSHR
jgi:hypothetical protein